jgi:hypothetical protein
MTEWRRRVGLDDGPIRIPLRGVPPNPLSYLASNTCPVADDAQRPRARRSYAHPSQRRRKYGQACDLRRPGQRDRPAARPIAARSIRSCSSRCGIDAIVARGRPMAASSSRHGNAAVIGASQISIKDSALVFRADLTVVGTSVKDNAAARRPRHFVYAAVTDRLSYHHHSQPTPPRILSAIGPVEE